MASHAFDCTRLLLGAMSCLDILLAFAIPVHTLTQEPIPDYAMHQMVHETIAEYDLPPLSGKRCRSSSHCIRIQKMAHAEYDHQRAEECVMSDWFGAVPQLQTIKLRGFGSSDIWLTLS
jgi:hypothetical protein